MGYFGFVLSSGGGRCFTPAYVNPHLIANDTSLFLLSISSISSGASNSPIKKLNHDNLNASIKSKANMRQ